MTKNTNPNTTNRFTCSLCHVSFKSLPNFRKHFRFKHKDILSGRILSVDDELHSSKNSESGFIDSFLIRSDSKTTRTTEVILPVGTLLLE